MSVPYIDTDVIIRFLTGDDPQKRAASAALFRAIERGETVVAAPDTVIADAVFVLTSPRTYQLSREWVSEMLATLIRLPGFRVANKRVVLNALTVFAAHAHLDFSDAMIVAAMREAGSDVLYAYDRDYDRVPGIERREP